jgi:hypothetical protein
MGTSGSYEKMPPLVGEDRSGEENKIGWRSIFGQDEGRYHRRPRRPKDSQ